jgi:hypothetical protein
MQQVEEGRISIDFSSSLLIVKGPGFYGGF